MEKWQQLQGNTNHHFTMELLDRCGYVENPEVWTILPDFPLTVHPEISQKPILQNS